MKALTVKDLDEKLLREVKAATALSGKTMREWIIDALSAALAKQPKRRGA
jgi:hypothetical protein